MHMADARNPLEIQPKGFLFEPDERGDMFKKKKQASREDPPTNSSASSSEDENGGNNAATSTNRRRPSQPTFRAPAAPHPPPPPSTPNARPPPTNPQFTPNAPPPPFNPQFTPSAPPMQSPQSTPGASPFGAFGMGATSTPNQSNTSPLRANSTFFNVSSMGSSFGHSSYIPAAGPSTPRTTATNNLTDYEKFLLGMQQNAQANVMLEVPLMSNTSGKACWFSTALRMLVYHQRRSRTGPPIRVNNITSGFLTLYQDMVLHMASNFRTVDPLPLLQCFAEEYLSHLPLNTVLTQEHEPDLVFLALRGFQATASRPAVQRCQYFTFAQPIVKTVTVNSNCCGQLAAPPVDTRYEGFLTVRLPENGVATLSNTIHDYFTNGIHLHFRCRHCGANVVATKRDSLVNAPDALPIMVYWTPPHPGNQTPARTPVIRPRISLQNNPTIQIPTDQEGVIPYKVTSSSRHFGSHLSGHYVFSAFRGIVLKEFFSSSINYLHKTFL